MNINKEKHCSLNKSIRELFYMKQNINNSITYTDEEKICLTKKIENDIIDAWKKERYNIQNDNG